MCDDQQTELLIVQDKIIKGLEHVIRCYRARERLRPPVTMEEAQNDAIRKAMIAAKGNRKKAAAILGIGERTLYRKIAENPMPNQHQLKDKRKCKNCIFYRHCGSEEPCSIWEEGDVVTHLG